MKIQINTDQNIAGDERWADGAEASVATALARFADQITRIELHVSDLNAGKFGTDDKRCLLEARLAGRQPVAVDHQAATVEEAIDGAADKLVRMLDSTLGRLAQR